jgi:signal transduction histidine kinase
VTSGAVTPVSDRPDGGRFVAPSTRLDVWDPSGPPVPLAPVLVEALKQAVLETEGEARRVLHHAGTPEEATTVLRDLTNAVRAALHPGQPTGALPRSILARALVAIVRHQLTATLAQLRGAVDAAEVVRLFGAVEQVSHALEPDWAQYFSDRLSGPDGLELVVEVAHDLRSPLTSILFLAETIQRGRSGPLTQVQERQLGLIYSAAFGLSSVASDVIELARGGDRLVDLDPIPFSVSDIFESVRDIVLPIAEEKGLAVHVHTPDADFRVGHPVALSRVLLNLTTNALKFTTEGAVEVQGIPLEGERVEFSVRDTGRGIPPQAMASLFEPFRRRQKPGEYAFSGSGLGLSICRKLVEAMGSTLQVETEAGVGTRFHFVLELPRASHGVG